MYRQTIEFKQLKPILCISNQKSKFDSVLGVENKLYKSLINLFTTFYIYTKPHRELYLVGGCVRDMLLDKEPKDYDLCTSATPDEVKKICDKIGLKYFDSGIKHGTLTIIDEFYGQSYEITTYRTESGYADKRHPDKVKFVKSLEEDLKRRDFTINSFAYNLLNQELVAIDESFLKDLELGIIRTVGDANKRFEEDALRMLRAIRFSAQLNFSISTNTYEAIKSNCNLIMYVSKERIRDELTKILLSDNPQKLELFSITGLEKYSLYDYNIIDSMLNCEHQNPWHYTDVFHHTMDVVKSLPKEFNLRWAGLLHDIGKPHVKELKEGTVDHYHYHGHQDVSAELALNIMEVLKFSNEQKDLIYKYVKYHDDDLVECRISKFKKVLNDIGKENFLNFIKLRQADANAHRLIKDTKYAIGYIDKIKERYLETVINDDALTVKDLKLKGDFIIEDGWFKGKEIGDCLNWLLAQVLEHPEYNTEERLKELYFTYKEMSFQNS